MNVKNTTNTSSGRPRAIADSLARALFRGQYAKGEKLPTERELATQYGANRNVIREALKRLEALGLVSIRQGSGIYVEDVQFGSGVLLFEVLMVTDEGALNLDFIRDVLEFRLRVMRMMVGAAAERRTEEELAELSRLTAARGQAQGDPAQVKELTAAIHKLMAQATHNQVYQFVFNTTSRIQMKLWDLIDYPVLGLERMQPALEQLVTAFEARDAAMAELLVMRQARAFYQETMHGRLHDIAPDLLLSDAFDTGSALS